MPAKPRLVRKASLELPGKAAPPSTKTEAVARRKAQIAKAVKRTRG